MNTHDILLIVQYITVGVLFAETLIVFLRWKNSNHSYLFLACVSSFISNMGYLLEMKAGSEEAYVSAIKLSYVGRIWIVFAFFLFAAKLCGVRLNKWFAGVLVVIYIGIYLSVLSIGHNTLYYKDYEFIADPDFPRFYHTNGNLHDLLMGLNVVLSLLALFWVIRAFHKEKIKRSKQRLLMLILSFGVQILFFILHVTGVFGFSKYYDLTMPGALFGTIFLLIGILGFDLLGAKEIARDFAIDRISEGVIAVDNDGRIQYFNEPATKIFPEFEHFFSVKPGKTKQTSKYTPYDRLAQITEAVQSGETLEIDDRIYTPEENDLIFDGDSYGKLYALIDDTEHYHYMEELQKQRDIADRANEAKSRFLANMSHEIRTPINAMLGMDEMILRESENNSIRSYASDIMGAGRTLLSLINDILDLSKVEEGKMEIIPVHYDLSFMINDLVNMNRERAAKKGLKLNVVADEHTPHLLLGDEIRVRQCAMNLLTNAVKYTEEGEVTLRITYTKTDDIHILLTITVEDTGIGMREEDMEHLFAPYKRIDERRNRTIEGTGLGMSITRQLLDLMQSELKVKSEYGKGSVFSFSILQEVIKWEELGDYSLRFDDMSEYTYKELFHAPDARILVVDDTEINLAVMQNLLKKTRIQIDTAISGKDALALVSDNAYDVLFIDHMMPEMDGIETLERIRETDLGRTVPAVALTANAVSGAREMYLDAGFTDYLSKPIEGERLEKMLLNLLSKDKLIAPEDDTDSEENAEPEEEEEINFLDHLKENLGIDEQSGLKNCGSEEGYLAVLDVFHKTAKDKADEIEKLYNENDIQNYTIKVHALKSSARIIGATALHELAKELEDAGKQEDLSFIQKNTEKLLGMYRTLDGSLTWLDRSSKNLPSIDAAALKEAYQTMVEIAGCMDYEMMDGILKDLRGYNLPKADAERISVIENMLSKLDWDGITEAANKGMQA